MRKIKFRVWNKSRKKMYYPVDDKLPAMELAFAENFWGVNAWSQGGEWLDKVAHSEDGDSLMQFTGLKDKNGKEIWEGDILGQDCKMVDDYTGKPSVEVQKLVVRWSMKKAQWTVYCPSAMIKDDWNYIPGGAYVIGNIHENPELLTP